MSNKTIKKQVLELSGEERAEVAHLLIDSLNPEAKYKSEKSWPKELKNVSTGMNKAQVQPNPGAR